MISFELPFPPSNNQYYRNLPNGRVVISKRGRLYKKSVINIVNLLGLNRNPIDYPVTVRVELHQPDNRKRDSDNFNKGMYDALTNAKFWIDDSLVIETQVRLLPKNEDPRAVVQVYADMESGFN